MSRLLKEIKRREGAWKSGPVVRRKSALTYSLTVIAMEMDDEICLCFHVTRRKVQNYIRLNRPRHASQLSECFGAGTGCGWCRKYLRLLFLQSLRSRIPDGNCQSSETCPEYFDPEQLHPEQFNSELLPGSDEYAEMRQAYIREGKGTPPPESRPEL